jgi:hypothetical protein
MLPSRFTREHVRGTWVFLPSSNARLRGGRFGSAITSCP